MAKKKKPNLKMRMRVVQEPKKRPELTEEQKAHDIERVRFMGPKVSYEQKRRLLDSERRGRKKYRDYRKSAGIDEYEKKVKAGTVTLEDIDYFGDYYHPLYQKFLKDHREKERKWTLEHKKQQAKKRALRKAAEAKARNRSK